MSLIHKCLMPLLVLAPAAAWAQTNLRDPTMPPPGMQAPVKDAVGTQGPAEAVVAQSVIRITPLGGGRKQAEMDGRTLQPGQSVRNNWRVVNITATSVVLKDSRGTRTLETPSETVRKKRCPPLYLHIEYP